MYNDLMSKGTPAERKKPCKVGQNKSDVVRDIPLACCDERAAVEFMERQRWDGTPCCPRCGSVSVYKMMDAKTGERNKRYLWRCRDCAKAQSQFTVKVGSVMEDSRIPLMHWCYAFWRACTSKKGVAAKEIQRQTGLSYKASLFLMHRVRFAMAGEAPKDGKLNGTVEVDETYCGGKPRYKGPHNKRGRGTSKQPVMALVERDGRVSSRVIPNVTGKTLKSAIREIVDADARIITDENSAYKGIGTEFKGGHEFVTHSAKEYVRKGTDIHSNTMESYFALVKRGMYGIWHNVSKKHLHRYIAASEFRYNTRKMEDGERTVAAIRAGVGKRLIYREPVAEA